MFRQLPARSLRLANTSAITFPLPSIHQFPFTSFFPFSPPKISPLSSPLSSPCLLTRIRYDDVEKLKNRWRNSVLPLFLNFPSQEKPTTRRQHSTLNTCPSLLTSNRTIFQPQCYHQSRFSRGSVFSNRVNPPLFLRTWKLAFPFVSHCSTRHAIPNVRA